MIEIQEFHCILAEDMETLVAITAQKIKSFGIDSIVDRIYDGKPMTAIAREIGVSQSSLSEWCAKPDNSARVSAARADTAEYWDRKAEEELRAATCPDEIAVARELAHHYRWRASKIAPRTYGDKIETLSQSVVTHRYVVALPPVIKTVEAWAEEMQKNLPAPSADQ